MKTPSRFQSVRKIQMSVDMKGVKVFSLQTMLMKPVYRLFSETWTLADSTKTIASTELSSTTETPATTENATTTTGRSERRGSLVIHHDIDEDPEHAETKSTGANDSMDISEDSFAALHDPRVEEAPVPLNEIVEEPEDEDDDEVVTVLKTPHAKPLHAKLTFDKQALMDSPLAGKGAGRGDDVDLEGSDKENSGPGRRTPMTPRPSDRSDSYITAPMTFPPDEPTQPPQPVQQPAQVVPEPVEPIEPAVPVEQVEHPESHPQQPHQENGIIETQVPLATSPERGMYLPSLPTRAPLNMKKSFGVRKSHRTSLMEHLAGRTSIIPNRKTFLPQPNPPTTSAPESAPPADARIPVEQPLVTPTQESADPVAEDGRKREKDDTITIIDTELQIGDERLKTKFTSDSQRIYDALNSLRTKSTPGQSLKESDRERIVEIETPAPVRTGERHVDAEDEDDWIPKTTYSLAEKLSNNLTTEPPTLPTTENVDVEPTRPEPVPVTLPALVIEKPTTPPPILKSPAPQPTHPSPVSTAFKNVAAQAAEVIRNAMAVITTPAHPQQLHQKQQLQRQVQHSPVATTSLYPRLDDDDPMTDMQNENFSVHYDDEERRDSTYFTQSDGPSQLSQDSHPQQEPPPHHATDRQSTTHMPPPRKDPVPAKKPVPVSIRVPTASQRQKEQQKKAVGQPPAVATVYPTLTQSRSVPDLASPGKLAGDDARMSSVSLHSNTGGFIRGAGQIKALNAAKLAKQRVRSTSCNKEIVTVLF